MKTNRRGFFATLIAPLLGRFIPKLKTPTGEVFFWMRLTPAQKAKFEAVNRFMVPPINVDSLTLMARKQLTLDLVQRKYLPVEALFTEEDLKIET